MCTSIDLTVKDHYFGRNLDLEYRFGEEVVICPRNYSFTLKNGENFSTKYAMIGMATVAGDYPLFAEAANEKGLAMAGLYFPGNAKFFDCEEGKVNLATFELIPYLLGKYASLAEVKEDLAKLNITNIPFAHQFPVTDLHWMLSDGKESLVIEQSERGLKIYPNPVGVLTNNPHFDWHLTNLRNYLNLSPQKGNNTFSTKVELEPYGQGMGALGLPGDNSPASRFVRVAFNKLNSLCDEDESSAVGQFFKILNSVAFVKGATITPQGLPDITTYSCCINLDKGIYYYTTYNNSQINAVRMTEENKSASTLSRFSLQEEMVFAYHN